MSLWNKLFNSNKITLSTDVFVPYTHFLPREIGREIAHLYAKGIYTISIDKSVYDKFLYDKSIVQQKEKYLKCGSPVLSKVYTAPLSEGNTIPFEVSSSTSLGNLVFQKEYDEAIRIGREIIAEYPHACMIHISLMMAYFKVRNQHHDNLHKCNYYAKQAIINGHNTGYAHERLAINLEKSGRIHQALQVCDLVLSDEYHFSSHGCGRKEDFLSRKEKLLKKIDKAIDTPEDKLFSDDELEAAFESMRIGVFEVHQP